MILSIAIFIGVLAATGVVAFTTHVFLTNSRARAEPRHPNTGSQPTSQITTIRCDGKSTAAATNHLDQNFETQGSPISLGDGFVPKGRIEEYAGFRLEGPIYISRLQPKDAKHHPSCIDPSLPVEVPSSTIDYDGKPSYTEFSPQVRYLYLNWLSLGAQTITPKAFPMLYLLGFERFVLARENTTLSELEMKSLQDIVGEIGRLRNLHRQGASRFMSCSSRLLDLIYIRFWPSKILERLAEFPDSDLANRYAAASLGGLVSQDHLLNVALHRTILDGTNERGVKLRRHYPLVRELFSFLLQERMPQKPNFTKSNKQLVLSYQPCQSGKPILYKMADLYDCWDNLEDAEICNEAYSQALQAATDFAKHSKTGCLADIISNWPENLPYKAIPNVGKLVSKTLLLIHNPKKPELGKLLHLFKISAHDSVKKTDFTKLQKALAKLGFFLVPDIRLTPLELNSTAQVVPVRGEPIKELSTQAKKVCLEIRLSKELAWTTGKFKPSRFWELPSKIGQVSDAQERAYSEAYFGWMTTARPSLKGLKSQIKSVDSESYSEIITSLIERSLLDGELEPIEIEFLETIFVKYFSLPAKDFFGALNDTIATAVSPNRAPSSQGAAGQGLDTTKLAFLKTATIEAQKVLHEALDDSIDESITDAPAKQEENQAGSWYSNRLNTAEAELLQWISGSDTWPLEEVELKCEQLGLMPTGALESINEASLDEFGENLIDIDDPLTVYIDIFETT